MDDGLTEIPKGNQIVRTPVSGGGVRMSVADPVAAAAAASKNPANVGISEQSGPASLVGQGGAGTGGGQDPTTPILPQSGSLKMTTQVEEVLSKIKGKCGQNRVLWGEMFKNEILPKNFLESPYDEDILFLPTLGCPDLSIPELSEECIYKIIQEL